MIALEQEMQASLRRHNAANPACPNCGRRYARRFYKPRFQSPSFECDPNRSIGGCGKVWDDK